MARFSSSIGIRAFQSAGKSSDFSSASRRLPSRCCLVENGLPECLLGPTITIDVKVGPGGFILKIPLMSRFLVIADTHFGAPSTGFQQQPKVPEKLPEILDALRNWILDDGGIDFILHAGDMVEASSDDSLRSAVDLFNLPVPVYLCLGNHDLTAPDAMARWMERAPVFFPNGRPEFTLTRVDCVIHVAPNHWDESRYHWTTRQDVNLSPDQITRLRQQLQNRPDLPHLLMTHSPVFAVPVEQTGLDAPFHPPLASFTETFTGLAAEHRNLRCVLGAHNHVNMRVRCAGVDYVTVSSLIETPFEFKVFDVTPDSITMETVSLADRLDFEGRYDPAMSFVQGRPIDRAFSTLF